MRYGFDHRGGFFAIDDTARVAAYAYATSTNATRAKRDAAKTAASMMAAAKESGTATATIRDEHYRHVCTAIAPKCPRCDAPSENGAEFGTGKVYPLACAACRADDEDAQECADFANERFDGLNDPDNSDRF